ncbi:hypothetical protein LJ739_18555 [Aestuariibacter halophilus]|uniref:Uncharacterized protein n=1 Tax=Fluctibacter halophilus TaxID=226011 RepID=A0ABS8GCI0_9ALTE|nr:hypothetical protein [Aestuariibacter halophilus]MCC2618265.1 hypothetical protein [Aestuariibacter halophilus]
MSLTSGRILIIVTLYAITMWLTNVWLGFLSLDAPSGLAKRDAGAALTLPLITLLCTVGCHYCLNGTAMCLERIHSFRPRQFRVSRYHTIVRLAERDFRRARFGLLIAPLTIASGYIWHEGIAQNIWQSNPWRLVLLAQAYPLWIMIFRLLYCLWFSVRVVLLTIRNHLTVRLYEIEELTPICHLVIMNVLFASLVMATYPLNLLFIPLPATDLLILAVLGGVLVSLLLYPVLVIHRHLQHKQRQMLSRINAALESEVTPTDGSDNQRRLVDDGQRLQYVADLLNVRKEISEAPLWPMNSPFWLKLFSMALIPVMAWIGAGIVSQLLKQWVISL